MSHIFLPTGLLNQHAKFLVAVAKGQADEAERLLTQLKLTGRGDPTNVGDETSGLYPIHLAASQGSESVCRMLVKHGARVNQITDIVGEGSEKRICLHYASMAGDAKTMKFLISAGADPHSIDAFGKKPYTFCRETETRKYLLIAMESWNNVMVAGDLLVKACMAQLLVFDQPRTSINSPHPKRLVTTYDTWYNELQKIRKENGVNIPMSTPPKPSFLRSSRNNLKVGQYWIVDRRQETGTMLCFGAVIHAKAVKHLGDDSICIEAFYVRKDMRRARMGTLLMYNLLTVYARKQFSHAVVSVADSNHVAHTFFRKMGFKSLLPDAAPKEHKKPMHTFFETQYIGLTLAKIEHHLSHYQDVKIIDDDDHLEEENQRVRDARQRRIDDKKIAWKEQRGSEQGAFFLSLERCLGVHGEKAQKIERGEGQDGGWWMKDPPVPKIYMGKEIPLIQLPKPPDPLRMREPYLPAMPPPAHPADSPLRGTGRGSFSKGKIGSNSLPELGNKHLDDDDGYAHVTKLASEIDRVPAHVLKQYEKDVLFHRDIADQVWKMARKTEGRLSKILRHEDDQTRSDYMSEFDHYETGYTLKRNLFPEGIVGAKPKPRFGVASTEVPEWNRGSKRQGFNFTSGRASQSKSKTVARDIDDD